MSSLAEVKDQCQAGMEKDLPSPLELIWGPYLGDKAPDGLKMILDDGWDRDDGDEDDVDDDEVDVGEDEVEVIDLMKEVK